MLGSLASIAPSLTASVDVLPPRPCAPSWRAVSAGAAGCFSVSLGSLMAKGTHQATNCAVACRLCTAPPAASLYSAPQGTFHETATEPARRAAGTGRGLGLGHQFRGDPAGAGCVAAAVLRHPAVCLRAVTGVSFPAQAKSHLGQSGLLWSCHRAGPIRPLVHRHERADPARPGFAGGADAGLLHHRAGDVAHGRTAQAASACRLR